MLIAALLRGSPQRDLPWIFLEGTEREAEQISEYFDRRQLSNRLFMRASGNEETFKRILLFILSVNQHFMSYFSIYVATKYMC